MRGASEESEYRFCMVDDATGRAGVQLLRGALEAMGVETTNAVISLTVVAYTRAGRRETIMTITPTENDPVIDVITLPREK